MTLPRIGNPEVRIQELADFFEISIGISPVPNNFYRLELFPTAPTDYLLYPEDVDA